MCVVTGRRHSLLDACLASLQAQQEAPTFELVVCADDDVAVEDTVRHRFPGATVLHVPKSLPSAGRNHLIDAANGDVLFFLDDDVVFGPHLLRDLGDLVKRHPEATVFGGPNTTPPDSSRFQVVQGAVLASLVASGPVRRRYGAHPAGLADERWFILCNLAVRRSAIRRFDEDLLCAEENALLADLRAAGERMHYSPDLAVYHERRADMRGFAHQMHKYGRGRGQLTRRSPRTAHAAYLLPAGLLAYLVLCPLLLAIAPWALVPAAVYAAAVAAGGVKVAATLRSARTLPLAMLLILVVHWFYGAGLLRELVRPRRQRTLTSTGEPASQPT